MRADPNYGGKLKLSALDLKQRYNHILRFALEGLDERKRKLLCRIAVLSGGLTYDTLAVLNPFLPPKPKTPTKEALRAYSESTEYLQAIRPFDKSLKELQDRGLLHWDRDSGHYDMHPVVRGHAAEFLDETDRKQTFLTVRDHFASLPPDDFEKATELSHVAHSVEIYRCLVGAALLDDAVSFYRGDLSNTLHFHLGASTLIVEMLRPLFHGGKDGLPLLTTARDQGFILDDLAFALCELGRNDEAMELFARSLRIDVEQANWTETARHLRNIAVSAKNLNRRAESAAALALALQLGARTDSDGVTMAVLGHACNAIDEGRFADAQRWLDQFNTRAVPNVAVYRLAEAEYWSCLSQFYQGSLTEDEWRRGYELAVQHRNILTQHRFLALRCEWLLTQGQAESALDVIDQALKIVNRLGTPSPDYHDLRAWALARLRREPDTRRRTRDRRTTQVRCGGVANSR